MPDERQQATCRECGCTNNRACIVRAEGGELRGCRWAEPDLCSACSGDDQLAEMSLKDAADIAAGRYGLYA